VNPAPTRSALGAIALGIRVLLVRLRFPALMLAVGLGIARMDDLRALVDRARRPAQAPDLVADAAHEFFCPMHVQVVRVEAGSCPICGMPLAKRAKGLAPSEGLPGASARVTLTPERLRRAGVETVPVERRPLVHRLEAYGEVRYDERRLARISSRTKGRVERLHVDFTGARVEKGAPLALLLAPDVTSAARELLLARRSQEPTHGGAMASAAEEKLRLLGLSAAQVERLAASGHASPTVEVLSPIAGTVIERKVLQGDWIVEGQELYTVADTSLVWVTAAIYEDEVGFVHRGQPVEIRAVAHPGRTFLGRVSFLEPSLDLATRSLRARIDVPNVDGLLLPGMAVQATLRMPIGPSGTPPSGGAVEWRCCTSCPDVVAPAPGLCPECDMPLTPVEKGGPPPSGTPGDPFVCACAEAPTPTSAPLPAPPPVPEPAPAPSPWLPRPTPSPQLPPAPAHAHAVASAPTPTTRTVFWCPMHPEVTQDTPGQCAKCGGMTLIEKTIEVPAAPASSGAHAHAPAPAPSSGRDPLVVPASAVIHEGRRALVWREAAPGVFEAVEVILGPRTGLLVPVISGLALGDRVVRAGAFLVDAEARLKPSAGAYFGASGGPAK